MHKQQGITQVILLLVVLLVAFSVLGAFLYRQQLNGVSSTTPIRLTQPYTSIAPSSPPSVIPPASPKPSESPLCDCAWVISSGTNVEFLVTSPSGQQIGYLQASNSYINTFPDASYGVQYGIGDLSGQMPPLPDMNYFHMDNPGNDIYTLQVIGKQPGNYHLDVSFVWGWGADSKHKRISIDGTLVVNQVDKYTVTIPSGIIQKVDK